MGLIVPHTDTGTLPAPCNDFDYCPSKRGTHTVGWVTVFMDDMTHASFDYTVSVCHVYPEHDGHMHNAAVFTDDDVHCYSLCSCCPDYELVDGDARKLLVVHRDMRYGEEPLPLKS